MLCMGISGVFYECYMANTNVVYWGNRDVVCLLDGGYWGGKWVVYCLKKDYTWWLQKNDKGVKGVLH